MNIKTTITKNEDQDTISMGDMKPLEVGVLVGGYNNGKVVMRTQSHYNHEVINLSDPSSGAGWSDVPNGSGHKLRLLKTNEKLIIEIQGTA